MVFNLMHDDLRRNAKSLGEVVHFFAIYHLMRNPLFQAVRRREEFRSERTATLLSIGVTSCYQSIAIK